MSFAKDVGLNAEKHLYTVDYYTSIRSLILDPSRSSKYLKHRIKPRSNWCVLLYTLVSIVPASASNPNLLVHIHSFDPL